MGQYQQSCAHWRFFHDAIKFRACTYKLKRGIISSPFQRNGVFPPKSKICLRAKTKAREENYYYDRRRNHVEANQNKKLYNVRVHNIIIIIVTLLL
jgi:hypothetical protein